MNGILEFTKNHSDVSLAITLVLMFCYQSTNIFWSLEPLDPGYYLTAYDNILDAPECVSDTFGQYLTNFLGGCIIKLFPSIGLVGFRIIGTALILFSVVFVFYAFKQEIKVSHILLGSSLVVICYAHVSNGNTFNNGILSCFFYVCAITLLYKGLVFGNSLLFLLGGIFAGINIFVRIPNLLGVLLSVVILLSDIVGGRGNKLKYKECLLFICGALFGISLIMAIIFSLGHEHIFLQSLLGLGHSATSAESSHSMTILIISQFFTYYNGIVSICLFFGVFYMMKRTAKCHLTKWTLFVLASFFLFYHVYLDTTSNNTWALSTAGCLMTICRHRGNLSLIASLGLFMLIIEPIGTNSGYGQASLPALIAAPVASMAVINRDNIYFVMVACIAIFMKVIKQGSFNEFGPLYEKKYKIESPECSFLYTTQDRAKVLNESLPELKKYIHEKDTLLVYDALPIINYLTRTRPAGGNSAPGYSLYYFERLSKLNYKPKILVHKFDLFGNWVIPTRAISLNDKFNKNDERLTINQYLTINNYKVVWENPYFMLLFPQYKDSEN